MSNINRKATIRRYITEIKKFLIDCGAEYLNKSDESDSEYVKFEDIIIRISDHIGVRNDIPSVVFPNNEPSKPVLVMSSNILSYPSIKELKNFLKSYLDLISLNESIVKNITYKKNAKIKTLTNKIKEKKEELDEVTSNINSLTKAVMGKKGYVDMSGLTTKQKHSIVKIIDDYKKQNTEK